MKWFFVSSIFGLLLLSIAFATLYGYGSAYDYSYPSNGEYVALDFETPTRLNQLYFNRSLKKVLSTCSRGYMLITGKMSDTVSKVLVFLDIKDANGSATVQFGSYEAWLAAVEDLCEDLNSQLSPTDGFYYMTSNPRDFVRITKDSVDSVVGHYLTAILPNIDPTMTIFSKPFADLNWIQKKFLIPASTLHIQLELLGIGHEYNNTEYHYTILLGS